MDKIDVRQIRRRLGLNQHQFWSRIGVTQSGGSRYESGRVMPQAVRQLLRLVHLEGIDVGRVKREDYEVLEYLKADQRELYDSLKKQARNKRQRSA